MKLPFVIMLIIIGIWVLFPVLTGFQPAMNAGMASGNYTGNTTTVPHYEMQNWLVGNMDWIASIIALLAVVLGALALLWKGTTGG